MQTTKERAALKAFLLHFHHNDQLARFLPKTTADEIQKMSPPQSSDFSSLFSADKWLSAIHSSWFVAPLQKLPKGTQELLVTLIPKMQQQLLRRTLGLSHEKKNPSPFVSLYLYGYLKSVVIDKGVIPLSLLPQSEMNVVLHLSSKELIMLINFLGLFDLSAEVKQILDKEVLKKIYGALSKDQLQFLHYAAKQPVKWTPAKMGLSQWDGDPKKLHLLLHHRGLMRYARGLIGENDSLRWHLVHKLDTGRAKVILSVFKEPCDASYVPLFRDQVLHIANRFKR